MKNRTRSTVFHAQNEYCKPTATKPRFHITKKFLAMRDVRAMVVSFIPIATLGLVLLYFAVQTGSSPTSLLGFIACLAAVVAFVPGIAFTLAFACLLADIAVIAYRKLR